MLSAKKMNSEQSANSENIVNSVSSYSAVLPPHLMIFLLLMPNILSHVPRVIFVIRQVLDREERRKKGDSGIIGRSKFGTNNSRPCEERLF